jgi:hypothetical protein
LLREKPRYYRQGVIMNKQYLTRSELTKRWSWELIERFFPTCSRTVNDTHGEYGFPLELYDVHQVRLTESTHTFKREQEKYRRRVKAIRENIKMRRKAKH